LGGTPKKRRDNFALAGDRIAALDTVGNLWVKEGPLNAIWGGPQKNAVTTFALAGDRIAALDTVGNLWVPSKIKVIHTIQDR